MNNIAKAVSEFTSREEEVRKILIEEFELESISNSDYQSIGYLAVDCGARLMNVLISARKPEKSGSYKAIMDLTIGLNGNAFWRQNGALLLPLLHAALQAQADYALLAFDKAANPNSTVFDKLMSESELVGLELFPAIGYFLMGYDQMAGKSLNLKKRLLPYLGM